RSHPDTDTETDRQTDRHRHEGEGGIQEVPIHPTQGGTPEERNRDETLDWHGQKERAREKGECQCAHKVGTYGRREREKDRKKDIQREWRGTAHRANSPTPTGERERERRERERGEGRERGERERERGERESDRRDRQRGGRERERRGE